MSSLEGELDSAPELVILRNCVGVVVEYTKISTDYSFTNQDPHALNRNRFLRIIDSNRKYQFRQITGLQAHSACQIWYPE